MKKLLAAILLTALCLPAPDALADGAPSVSAEACVVMEAQSGRLLLEKNANAPMRIASTTKILTALVALERAPLSRAVTVTPEQAAVEGSSIYLTAGETCTVEELLYGMLLESGNDAAEALAGCVAGSREAFAALMNEKAAALGCTQSRFENPCGLDGENHRSTAAELALITRAALENEAFRKIVSSRSAQCGSRTFYNHNRLLGGCEGVFGVKTGYTMAAGRCLVTACEREGMTLICVTLRAPDDWRDHAALYDWAFANYTTQNILPDGLAVTVPLVGAAEPAAQAAPDGALCPLREKSAATAYTVELAPFHHGGTAAGQTAGTVTALVDGRPAGTCPLVFTKTVVSDESLPLTAGEKFLRFLKLAGRNVYQII